MQKEHHAIITVTDMGKGIPEYTKEINSNRFYSLSRSKTGKQSSGLGLSFVKEAMELHRGLITIDNWEEGGVEVRLKVFLQLATGLLFRHFKPFITLDPFPTVPLSLGIHSGVCSTVVSVKNIFNANRHYNIA